MKIRRKDKETDEDLLKLYSNVYSAFTNNGYVADADSITGFSEDQVQLRDLLTQTDLTRFA